MFIDAVAGYMTLVSTSLGLEFRAGFDAPWGHATS